MNSTLLEFQEPMGTAPQFSPIGLARLDVSPPVLRSTDDILSLGEQVDWDQVHRLVQRIFSKMAAQIQSRWPTIRSSSGRSSARSFFLFTFVSFDLGVQEELDPVIVGLSFEPAPSGDGIMVSGDICGEETGRIDFELAESSVPISRCDVLPIALEMATRLGEQTSLIAKSVFERHPPPEY